MFEQKFVRMAVAEGGANFEVDYTAENRAAHQEGLSDQKISAISGHKSMQMLKRYTSLRGKKCMSKSL